MIGTKQKFVDVFLDLFFFFQAEDGIRDHCVTGVQTCALPILPDDRAGSFFPRARETPSNVHSRWGGKSGERSEEHTSELQSHSDLVCRLLLEKKKTN